MTVAIWCVLVAALLPYVPFALVSRQLDQGAPRWRRCSSKGLAARAHGAHLNAFEAFPFFAAAVIVSQIVEGASATVAWLAVGFVLARIGHIGFYLADRPPLRSACFTLGLLLARRHLRPSGLSLIGPVDVTTRSNVMASSPVDDRHERSRPTRERGRVSPFYALLDLQSARRNGRRIALRVLRSALFRRRRHSRIHWRGLVRQPRSAAPPHAVHRQDGQRLRVAALVRGRRQGRMGDFARRCCRS